MDESGDLGFNFEKKGTSRYFVVAAIMIDDDERRLLDRVIKKTYSKTKSKFRISGMLHANAEREGTRKKMLKYLENVACKIVYAVADKRDLLKTWGRRETLYEHMVEAIFMKLMQFEISAGYSVKCYVSRRETNRNKNILLKSHLKLSAQNVSKEVLIEIMKPTDNKGLQVADFVSWSVFAMLNGDDSYFSIIQDKVVSVITIDY